MAYFSRFPHFPRPRWNNPMPMPQPMSQRTEEDQQIPFIPPVYKFRPSKKEWKHVPTTGLRTNSDKEQASEDRTPPPCSQLRIITWNVDMASPRHEERLHAALRHIEDDVLNCKEGQAPVPCCILLQEVRDTIVPFLLKDEWVRRWFVVTPFTKDKWPEGAYYGNITLVSRSLNIAECHILHYGFTSMQRTSLCVKLKLNFPGSQEKAVIAIVNTHLESLPSGAPARPKQLEMCARFLRLEGVHGGVIAGDMNAIGKEDATIGKDVGLRDSWRKGEVEMGKTWGYQGQNEGGFPCNRLDKVFYLPGMGYKVDEPKRIGLGLKISEETNNAMWVSDHYGLETTLRMKPRSTSA
ncbi:Endonuclease/exonuclease/phosphatase [Flammula alnicola]|nr:Endonuclease/exonuclease/phosphatase [Flammula alnicola]